MAELKEYTFTIDGIERTVQLDEDDAKRYQDLYGDQPEPDGTGDLLKQAGASNKSRSASNKAGDK
jgi:hypothetical protein